MSGPSRTPAPTGCENGATVGQMRDERGMMEGTELREKKK